MEIITSQWLEDINTEFKRLGIVDSEEKTVRAIEKWSQDNVSNQLPSEDVDLKKLHHHLEMQEAKIRSYFLTQMEKDRGWVEPPFIGIYYFRGEFWPIVVPLAFGRVGIDIIECLKMPSDLKRILVSDETSINEYIPVWADSIDYAYAIQEVERQCNDFSKTLFRSADKHLRAVISLLKQEKASSASIADARMSLEIFLKAYLSVKEGLADADMRKQIGHNLNVAIDRCINHGLQDLNPIKAKLHNFPDVGARYEAPEMTLGELWTAYRVAHMGGIAILRHLTGRDSRNTIQRR